MKIVYFNICALVLVLFMLLSYLLRKIQKTESNTFFIMMLVDIMFASIFGSIAVILDNNSGSNPVFQNAAHFGYLFFHNITAVLYIFYLITLTGTLHKFTEKKLGLIGLLTPVILVLILLTASLFNGCMFYIDDNGVYTRTKIFPVLYAVGIFYLLFGVYYVLSKRKLFTTKWAITSFLFYPLVFAAMIIEYFYNYIVIELFANAISILFVYMNIQSQTDLLDRNTNLFNKEAFSIDCEKFFRSEKEFAIVFVNLIDSDSAEEILGFENWAKYKALIAKTLEKIIKDFGIKPQIYYVNNGQFRVMFEKKDYQWVDDFSDEALNRIKDIQANENIALQSGAFVSYAYSPIDISNSNDLIKFENHIYPMKDHMVLEAKYIVKSKDYVMSNNIDMIIDRALEENLFKVYYQPIYSVKKKKFEHAEALLRLTDPDYGYISPDIIATRAEKNGKIHKIGNYVLNEVCKFIASEDYKKLGLKSISINVSTAQFMQENFAERVIYTCSDYNIDPSNLNCEVLETALAIKNNALMSNVERLRNVGIKTSLDDFGIGYSNIRRLVGFPLDITKIDKSLVQGISDKRTLNVVKDCILLMKHANLEVVVEGIETPEQLEIFENLDVEYIQGFYFSKALPKDEFVSYITNYSDGEK